MNGAPFEADNWPTPEHPDGFEDWDEDDLAAELFGGDALTRICPKCGNPTEWPDCVACGYSFQDEAATVATPKPPAPAARPAIHSGRLESSIPRIWKGAALRHIWTYRGPDGAELAKVARFDHPDGRKEVIPFKPHGDFAWKAGALPAPHPLFALDTLAHADPARAVFVVEGEKCAAALVSLGLISTTWQGGSNATGNAAWEALSGRERVYILPDHDAPGDKAAAAVASTLRSLDRPPALFRVDLPELPEGGDVADWIAERLPGWDGFETVPEGERERIRSELGDTIKAHARPYPIDSGAAWPELQPLATIIDGEPYPLDALPRTIREAVGEVQAFVKAPAALVAGCALSAVSLAVQTHADVRRAERLTGPAGLYLLTIADSGERKTTVDGFFTQAIRDYERAQADELAPELKRHAADESAWAAQRAGILAKITDLAKKGQDATTQRRDLEALELAKPEPPRVPALLMGDETPENLAWRLFSKWPSGGVVSSEAGVVFGGHAMGKDSIMRNLSRLNVLWDGGELAIGRRTSESFTVRGARLTVALQVQEATLREFFERAGALARGTGFLARFLIAWPASTQGRRTFTEAPAHWPALGTFNRRLSELLNQPAPIGEDGALSPQLLDLSPDAKAAWVAFHDAVEVELAEGGELRDVRDVASKTADNAARLAALFHAFEGHGGPISLDAFEGASRIAAWHLNEARRFFGELILPPEVAAAARLEAWLVGYCRREGGGQVPTREVLRGGPPEVRNQAALLEALATLEEAGRARLVTEGRRKLLEVRPELLNGEAAA